MQWQPMARLSSSSVGVSGAWWPPTSFAGGYRVNTGSSSSSDDASTFTRLLCYG